MTRQNLLFVANILKENNNLTVLTNDIIIAKTLEDFDSIEIFLLGGIIRNRFHCTVGVQGKNIYPGLIVDKAFMGVNGLSFDKGATTPDINQSEI